MALDGQLFAMNLKGTTDFSSYRTKNRLVQKISVNKVVHTRIKNRQIFFVHLFLLINCFLLLHCHSFFHLSDCVTLVYLRVFCVIILVVFKRTLPGSKHAAINSYWKSGEVCSSIMCEPLQSSEKKQRFSTTPKSLNMVLPQTSPDYTPIMQSFKSYFTPTSFGVSWLSGQVHQIQALLYLISRVQVQVPLLTLVTLSQTLDHYCYVLRMEC